MVSVDKYSCSVSGDLLCSWQEKGLGVDKYTFLTYLCYLTYAPLYIAGPVVSYNAFAAQVGLFSR